MAVRDPWKPSSPSSERLRPLDCDAHAQATGGRPKPFVSDRLTPAPFNYGFVTTGVEP
jgi:hypothetical protein